MKKKLLTLCLTAGLLWPAGSALAADAQVAVTLPAFPVVLNGVTMEQQNNQYPLLVYKNITYVPMTYYDAQLLGLTSVWNAAEGLTINRADFVADQKTAQQQYVPYTGTAKNQNQYQAVRPGFAITVNGKKIDNSKEEYPLLVFRDVTYFPLTWRFAVDEFGWNYTFDGKEGLRITPVPTPAAPQASGGTAVTVTGSTVNLRSGAGTNYATVGQVQQGTVLTVLDSALDKDGALWYQVQSKNSAQSWIASWLVQTSTAENSSDKPAGNHNDGTANNNTANNNTATTTENGVIANGTTVYVTGDVVNLRSGAGTNYSQLGQAVCGEALTVQGHSQDNDGKLWYQVPTEDGVTMWIASWLVSSRKPVGDGSSYTSTGVRTQLELGAVQRDGKKTVLSLKHGANNAYSVEKVNGTTLQLLLDNVTVGSDTQCQGNGFTLKASSAGNNKVRITLTYPLGCYANIVQDGDWLLLNSYHTGSGLAGRTIVLDPGHGGSDPGSVSSIMPEVTDADVGYDVAVKLRAMLEQAGATVILTREDLPRDHPKVFLAERVELCNQAEPDLFISIHANSTDDAQTTASGARVHVYNSQIYSRQYLSKDVADKICVGLRATTGKQASVKKDNFYVLRLNNHPSVLVEAAFLNNAEDVKLLAADAYRQKLAQGIYDGVVDYFNQF